MRLKFMLFGLILVSATAAAQSVRSVEGVPNLTFARDTNTYGTASETVLTIFQDGFSAPQSGITWSVAANSMKYVSSCCGCCLNAPLTLPAGAAVVAVGFEGCDSSSTGALSTAFIVCPVGANCGGWGTATTGVTATPPCGVFRANLLSPITIDNFANTYYLQVDNADDETGAVSFRAGRVYYKLQVSPAPGTATFTDVPTTHLFFQYVEALAAAGVTAGCGGGNFCPDAAVTRGQMAVFLSRALGLHWAP